MNWNLREPKKNDISFIYSTWLKSYHYDSWTKNIAKSIFFDHYKLIIDEILLTAQIKVACSKDDEDIILGYLVFEDQILHYCFVKDAFRGYGIATNLVKSSLNSNTYEISHRTHSLLNIIRDRKDFIYNPFKLYKGV